MTILDNTVTGVSQLWAHKLRSLLTLLGMIIGVGAVIGIVSIGEGLQRLFADEFSSIGGSNLIWVTPLQVVNKNGRWVPATVYEPLTWTDVRTVEASSEHIEMVLPVVTTNVELRYRKSTFKAPLEGTIPGYTRAYQWPLEKGRFFTDRDVARWRSVCVLGDQVVDHLFGESDPIGKEVKLNDHRFTVIGEMAEKEFLGVNWGERVLVPITSAQKRIVGHVDHEEINTLIVLTEDPNEIQAVISGIEQVMEQQHNPEAEYDIGSGKGFLEQIDKTLIVIKFVVGSIAGISLIVGGIGIMNMMLVSVTERTREIGIRKAVGAKPLHIIWQFTLEAITLSAIGGLLGIVCAYGIGFGVSWVIEFFSDASFPSVVSVSAMIVALAISVSIGLFFGIYPAMRASRLNLVDALRFE